MYLRFFSSALRVSRSQLLIMLLAFAAFLTVNSGFSNASPAVSPAAGDNELAVDNFSREYIKNGDLEKVYDGPNPHPGKTLHWTGFKWEGHGSIEATNVAVSGQRAIMINGNGPSKQAIFQKLNLSAGTYSLTALVASRDLRPNHWNHGAVAYVSFEGQERIFQKIFASDFNGNSDWRKMKLTFTAEKSGNVFVYFFNYGSGALFVDQISLHEDSPLAPSQKQQFELATEAVDKLLYTAPLQPADRALAGYCSKRSPVDQPKSDQSPQSGQAFRALQNGAPAKDKAGASSTGQQILPFCQNLLTVKNTSPPEMAAKKPVLLADFATLQPFEKGSWEQVKGDKGQTLGRLAPGKYMMASQAKGLLSNWQGHDWLSFTVNNPSRKAQKISLEIHDDKSKGYWSRVNYYSMAPPGTSRLRIPLQIFVGEKSVIKERRRLDLAHIKKLVLSSYEASSKLDFSNLQLEPEAPFRNDFARLIKLDAGPPTAPLFFGFTPLKPDYLYKPGRGYGYSLDAKIARSEDRRHPDNLFRDWTSINKGGLDFDLPNGRYHVWMMLEDPGYWEYFPNFSRRKVMAEDQLVLDESMDASSFEKKYFAHADDEDLPGANIWKRYIRSRYKPLRFEVEVRDGQLNLRFDSNDNPYALALSALVIYPDEEKKRGDRFLQELWQKLEQGFNSEYRQVFPTQSGKLVTNARALGGALSLFRRSAGVDVFAFDLARPDEVVNSRLKLALARGETGPLTLSLHAHEDLKLSHVQLVLPGLETTPFKVRNKITRLSQDGTVFWNAPRLLDPLDFATSPSASGGQLAAILPLPANSTRRLWFDIKVPATMKETKVSGYLRLTFAPNSTIDLPVTVQIHPWSLPESDIFNGYLGLAPQYPYTPWSEIRARAINEMGQAVSLLQAHGMNRFSGGVGGPAFKGYKDGQLQMDFADANQSMSKLKETGGQAVESYLGLKIKGLSVYRPDKGAQTKYDKPYSQILGDVLRAIKKHGQEEGWADISHVVGDEPSGEAIDESIAAAKAFKATGTGAKTSIFTSITSKDADRKKQEFGGVIDLIYLNEHSKQAIEQLRQKGSDCALYNMGEQYRRGIYLFKMRQLGCKGHMQYAFNSTHVDPYYDLDGREADLVGAFAHPDGRLRQTLDLKRYRQAIMDYRYLLKLEQAIGKSSKKDASGKARQWLDNLLARMKVGAGKSAAWPVSELDKIRSQAIALINSLQ